MEVEGADAVEQFFSYPYMFPVLVPSLIYCSITNTPSDSVLFVSYLWSD